MNESIRHSQYVQYLSKSNGPESMTEIYNQLKNQESCKNHTFSGQFDHGDEWAGGQIHEEYATDEDYENASGERFPQGSDQLNAENTCESPDSKKERGDEFIEDINANLQYYPYSEKPQNHIAYPYTQELDPFINVQPLQEPKQMPFEEVENDSEDEGITDYKIGGYHPVHIGEVVLNRYVIIQKLGWGHFSTVWLAKDFKYDTYVALKIQKSSPNYLEAAYDEVEILQRVARNVHNPEWVASLKEYYKDEGRTVFGRDDCQVLQLLNSFIYKGPYGNHFCMVFEILGVNLLEIIKRYNYKGIPMHLARIISKQILIGLDYLHRICKVIHTDLKPENVLVCLTKEEIREIYEDGMLKKDREYSERINNCLLYTSPSPRDS
eukprot:TRINITY_DN4333_c0_g1_i5.p1 TRINITY_DN4333_c0_g1~~TRINITY_DN4333_c0_g1_i5.p1  ORF type:complete len:380 (-),score=34.15 TRINITY_DN4333_c0_g1_i5:39-1178(-)